MSDLAVRWLRNGRKEKGVARIEILCLAVLVVPPLSTAAQAQPCAYPPYEVHLEGDVHPLETWPSWMEDGNGETVVIGDAFTMTDYGDGYGMFQPNGLLSEGTWARLAVRIRVDSYVLLNESSGNFFGYADLDKRVIFGLIMRGGSPYLTFADQELMDNGIGDPALPTYALPWDDGEYHEIDLLIDYSTGTYELVIDSATHQGQYQNLPDMLPEELEESPWALAMFSVGASTVDGTTTYDYYKYDVCVEDCATRGGGEGAYEGDVLPTEADPPWLIPEVTENTRFTLVPNSGVLDIAVWSTTSDPPGELLLYMPAFPDMGIDVQMSARARQSTYNPTPLPDWRMETGFGFTTAVRSIFIGLLDRGAGDRAIGLAGINEQGEAVILGLVDLDWTQFHEYTIIDSVLSDYVELRIDNVPSLSVLRDDFPAVVFGSPGDGLAFISGAGENPVISHIDFIRWEYKREGFVFELCDGYDNDCDGLVDNIGGDSDGDGVFDGCDNCSDDYNPGQEDSDENGVGDVCDEEDPPIANAGPDQTVDAGDQVFLDGTGSHATIQGSEIVEFKWSQVSGQEVVLFGFSTSQPAFTAKDSPDYAVYEFELVVSDGLQWSAPDRVLVTAMRFDKKEEHEALKRLEKTIKSLKGDRFFKKLKNELLSLIKKAKKTKSCWEKIDYLETFIELVDSNKSNPTLGTQAEYLINETQLLTIQIEPCVGGCDGVPKAHYLFGPAVVKGHDDEFLRRDDFNAHFDGIFILNIINGVSEDGSNADPVHYGSIKINNKEVVGNDALLLGPPEFCIPVSLLVGKSNRIEIAIEAGQKNSGMKISVISTAVDYIPPPPSGVTTCGGTPFTFKNTSGYQKYKINQASLGTLPTCDGVWDAEEFRRGIVSGVDVWNEQANAAYFRYRGSTDFVLNAECSTGHSVISATEALPGDPWAIASAWPGAGCADRFIVLIYNDRAQWGIGRHSGTSCRDPSTFVNLRQTVTHEIGHTLDLGHLNESSACKWSNECFSAMRGGVPEGEHYLFKDLWQWDLKCSSQISGRRQRYAQEVDQYADESWSTPYSWLSGISKATAGTWQYGTGDAWFTAAAKNEAGQTLDNLNYYIHYPPSLNLMPYITPYYGTGPRIIEFPNRDPGHNYFIYTYPYDYDTYGNYSPTEDETSLKVKYVATDDLDWNERLKSGDLRECKGMTGPMSCEKTTDIRSNYPVAQTYHFETGERVTAWADTRERRNNCSYCRAFTQYGRIRVSVGLAESSVDAHGVLAESDFLDAGQSQKFQAMAGPGLVCVPGGAYGGRDCLLAIPDLKSKRSGLAMRAFDIEWSDSLNRFEVVNIAEVPFSGSIADQSTGTSVALWSSGYLMQWVRIS